MEPTSRGANTNVETKNIIKSPPVEVKRNINAPIERVWQAWSDTDLIMQWWGPEGFLCPEARTDFREGGKYLFAMKGPDGKLVWSGGVYEELIPNKKIVYTDNFTDKNGQVVSPRDYGMPGEWGGTTRVTVELEVFNDQGTRMTLRHDGIPAELHDDCVQGWTSTVHKLQRLVERM